MTIKLLPIALLFFFPFGMDYPSNIPANQPAQIALKATFIEEKVKFKLANGTEAFSFKLKENGAKLEGSDGKEIARFTLEENRKIKIKDPADRVLGYIVPSAGAWKIENARQTREVYIFRKQADGDYKLETREDKPIYRVKKRDYGFEIETADRQSLYKVKIKKNKLELRDKSDRVVLETRADFPASALVVFGFDTLTREQKAALAYSIYRSGG